MNLDDPESWRRFLTTELLSQQKRFDILEDYASGNHPLPTADRRYFKALQEVQQKARANYYGMVNKAPGERMRVKGFRFGKNGGVNETAKAIWAFNDFDYQNKYVLKYGAEFGRGYILISPPEPGTEVAVPVEEEKKPEQKDNPKAKPKFPVSKAGQPLDDTDPDTDTDEPETVKKALPVMTYESPRMCITFQDPIRPTKSLAGLKLWSDYVEGRVKAILWLPDSIHWYDGPQISQITGMPFDKLKHTLSTAEGVFEEVRSEKNEIGEVPLVYIEWQTDAIAEGEDLLDIQDRINLTLLHRLVITQNQSFRQRWMTGVTPRKGKKAADRPMFDPGADMLWVTDSETAKFGDFAQADIKQVLEAVRDDIVDMASLSKTPVHYLMGRLANVSGDTLTQGESGFVSKIRDRMASVGWGLERAMRVCFKYLGDTENAEQIDAEVIWADPEVRTRAEIADAAVKEAQVLATAPPYALALVMERMGFDPDQIAFAMAEREKLQAEERAREDQMLAQEHENLKESGQQQIDGQTKLAAIAAKGRPGSGGSAAKKAGK